MRKAVLLVLLAALPVFAAERPAVFCKEEYALCIKAPCLPIITRTDDGKYVVTQANCTCEVLTGWSMGPGDCASRKPVTRHDRTYLVSTYSNYYNETNKTLSCDKADTVWALCYGAPCAIDEKDPSKAVCTCPLKTGKSKTLGGNCDPKSCMSIWSAATPAQDKFANDHFYKIMKERGYLPPPNPPAQECPAH